MRNFINSRYTGSAPAHMWLGVSIENASTLARLRHLKETHPAIRFVSFEPLLGPIGKVHLTGIHRVIVGGESGAKFRDVDRQWVRQLRHQCIEQQVAFFFEQWGGRTSKARGNRLDGRQWLQFPTLPQRAADSGAVPRKGTGDPSAPIRPLA